MKKYTVDYFIKKFQAIPVNQWGMYSYSRDGKFCALGHCGYRNEKKTYEGSQLFKLFEDRFFSVTYCNDGIPAYTKYGKTPKTRILTVLKQLKKMGDV